MSQPVPETQEPITEPKQPIDLFQKCWDFTRADEIKAAGFYPYFRAIEENEGPVVQIEGRKVIMAGSNNYLGLTAHPKVKEAALRAVEKYGTGCSGSRYLTGTLDLHNELERRLANYMGTEACLLFSTGYQTAQGIIPTVAQRGEYILTDKDNHACIVAGTLMAKGMFAEVIRFKHNDMNDLERQITRLPAHAGKLGDAQHGRRLCLRDGRNGLLAIKSVGQVVHQQAAGVAEPLGQEPGDLEGDLVGQQGVVFRQALEIALGQDGQLNGTGGDAAGGTPLPVDDRHFAQGLAGTDPGHGLAPAGAVVLADIYVAGQQQGQEAAHVALPEQHHAGRGLVGLDVAGHLLDLGPLHILQQMAGGQQFAELVQEFLAGPEQFEALDGVRGGGIHRAGWMSGAEVVEY